MLFSTPIIVGFISPHRCCSFEVFRNGASKNHGVLGVQEALPSYAGRCRRLLRRRRWSTRRSGASVSGGRRSHAFPMEGASGKHRKSDGTSPFLVSKPRNSMISMVISIAICYQRGHVEFPGIPMRPLVFTCHQTSAWAPALSEQRKTWSGWARTLWTVVAHDLAFEFCLGQILCLLLLCFWLNWALGRALSTRGPAKTGQFFLSPRKRRKPWLQSEILGCKIWYMYLRGSRDPHMELDWIPSQIWHLCWAS